MNDPDSCVNEKVNNLKTKLLGTGLSVLTGILWLGIDIIFKKMKIDFADATLVRSIFQTGMFLPIVKLKRYSVWVWSVDEDKDIHKIRFLQILQGLTSGISLMGHLAAIQLMDIGDAMAIHFSSFLPTMILSRLFLKVRPDEVRRK